MDLYPIKNLSDKNLQCANKDKINCAATQKKRKLDKLNT